LKFSILILFILSIKIYSDNISFETFTLTTHVSKTAVVNGNQYPRKLDENGWIIFMPGLEIGYQYDTHNNFLGIDGYKVMIANYSDSRAQHSGYLQMGPRWIFNITSKLDVNIGIGPLLFFRKSWREFDNYTGNAILKEKYGYEYIIFIFGDIDIRYKISKNLKVVWGIIPAIPYSIANTVGLVYEF
jgi:hypothetical protein